MAVRAEELRQDDLLTRYLTASRRYATQTQPLRTNDLMLARYLKALQRHDGAFAAVASGDALRTCTGCGRRVQLDPSPGGWSECPVCDALA